MSVDGGGLREFTVEGTEIYRKEGVLIQTTKDDKLHSGCLCVTETKHGVFITWKKEDIQQTLKLKNEEPLIFGSPPDPSEWAVIASNAKTTTPKDRVKFHSSSNSAESPAVKFSSNLEDRQLELTVELGDVKSYRLGDDGNTVTLLMRDGTTHNTLVFLDEGPEDFLKTFTGQMSVRSSRTDDYLFLLTDKKTAALDQSLSELNLFDKPNGETVWRAIGEIQRDPYTAGLSILSKVADRLLFSPLEKEYRPEDEMAELLQGDSLGSNIDCQGEGEGEGDGSSDNWQLVNSRRSLLKGLDLEVRAEPLCQLDWTLHINEDGIVEDVPELLDKIYRGGIESNIRPDLWKYLLGLNQWHHTNEVRETNRKARVEEYYRMKLQWKSMSEDQQNRFAAFRERKSQIEKDIGRTDRNHPFFEGDDNPNVALLQEILMTYVMYNFDLGYVQGMSDLLSPLLFVLKNEVDAFWCFVGFMDKVASNFEFDQGGMKRQLSELTVILKFLDLSFYNYLESKDSGNLFFCFRWLLIWYKREFTYTDTMKLWEVIWTKKPCKNFHLLLCVALLDTSKSSIIENKYGFTEILKHVNDMSHRINLDQMLSKADGIYKLLKQDPNVPDQVLNILGIEPGSSSCDKQKVKIVNGKTMSLPVPINGNTNGRMRHESSNASGSLNHSSSVEVLSEAEENRYEDGINAHYF